MKLQNSLTSMSYLNVYFYKKSLMFLVLRFTKELILELNPCFCLSNLTWLLSIPSIASLSNDGIPIIYK